MGFSTMNSDSSACMQIRLLGSSQFICYKSHLLWESHWRCRKMRKLSWSLILFEIIFFFANLTVSFTSFGDILFSVLRVANSEAGWQACAKNSDDVIRGLERRMQKTDTRRAHSGLKAHLILPYVTYFRAWIRSHLFSLILYNYSCK
jgi:hypothetical protein